MHRLSMQNPLYLKHFVHKDMYIWALKNILANMKTFFMRITREKRNGELYESEVKYFTLI